MLDPPLSLLTEVHFLTIKHNLVVGNSDCSQGSQTLCLAPTRLRETLLYRMWFSKGFEIKIKRFFFFLFYEKDNVPKVGELKLVMQEKAAFVWLTVCLFSRVVFPLSCHNVLCGILLDEIDIFIFGAGEWRTTGLETTSVFSNVFVTLRVKRKRNFDCAKQFGFNTSKMKMFPWTKNSCKNFQCPFTALTSFDVMAVSRSKQVRLAMLLLSTL